MTTYATRTDTVRVPQWTRGTILRVWAAAAIPMGVLAWVVAPLLARTFTGPAALQRALILSVTAGLVWQFALVLIVVRREQGTLRWPVLREALWLRAPSEPSTGRSRGRLWLVLIPCLVLFGAEDLMPELPFVPGHDLPEFLGSHAGSAILSGSVFWLGVLTVLVVFNTVLGEELLFRGLLLPRMGKAFGRADWIVNGILFALYHLHMPWAIPTAAIDTVAISYPSRRYRSALIGIIVHSAQSVVVLALAFKIFLT